MEKEKIVSTKNIVLMAMFMAILSVLSQISIPLPMGLPITLQTLGIALCGFVLGRKLGMCTVIVYIGMGTIGLPVFSNFAAGPGVLLGKTGGFLIGFILMAFLCGVGIECKNKFLCGLFSIAGLLCCHLCGILQFAWVAQLSLVQSALLVSLQFLLKDIASIVAAYGIALAVRRSLTAVYKSA